MVARYPEGTKRGGCVASIIVLIDTPVNTRIQTALVHLFQKIIPQLFKINAHIYFFTSIFYRYVKRDLYL